MSSLYCTAIGDHQLEAGSLNVRVQELVGSEKAMQQAHCEEVAQWCEKMATLTQEAEKR